MPPDERKDGELNILLLEDNPADAEIIEFELREAGFDFTLKWVATGKEFIQSIEEEHYDLVLADYDVPGYSGLLALAEVKERSPDVPFILVTGAVTEDRAIEVLTSGATDYVLKHRLARLAPAVKRALEESEEHKARKKAERDLRESYHVLEQRVKERTAELERARLESDERKRRLEEVLEAFPVLAATPADARKKLAVAAPATVMLLAALLAAIGYWVGPSAPVLTVLPWFVPVISLFNALIFFAVAFLSLERYHVLRNPSSFWIGMGAQGYGVAVVFYALAWPGLLPDRGSIIANLSGTAEWFLQSGITILIIFTFAAVLLSRPRFEQMKGTALILLSLCWTAFLALFFTVAVRVESFLPTLVNYLGDFTPLLRTWNVVGGLLFAAGAILSVRRYARTSDSLLGYIAILQASYAFSIAAAAMGMSHYDLWWYVVRLVLTGSGLLVFFGLLSEYVFLFRREREKTAAIRDAEEALKKNEYIMKKGQEIARLGSWELDIAANRLTWSDETYRIFGIQPQEFAATYDSFLELVHPEDRDSVHAAYSQSIRDNLDMYEINHRLVRKNDGAVRHVREKCENIRAADGNIIRSVGMVHDVTEDKLREEALKAERATLRATIDSMPLGVWIADTEGRLFMANEQGKNMWRESGEPARNIAEYERYKGWRPDTGEPLKAEDWAMARALNKGETVVDEEVNIRRLDGTSGTILNNAGPIYDEGGRIIGAVTVAQDITERKRHMESVRDSEERHRLLFENMGEGFALCEMICDEEGRPQDWRYVQVNRGWVNHTGLQVETTVGRTARELIPGIEPYWIETFGNVVKTGEPVSAENYTAGLSRWFEIHAYKHSENHFAVLFQDVTKRKQAEEELARQRVLMQLIMDNIPVLLVIWDANMQRFTLNLHAENVLRWTTQEANEGDFMSKVYPDPEYRAEVMQYMQSLQEGWQEWEIMTKDGRCIPIDWANVQLTKETMVGIGVDVHERRAAERALKESYRELESFAYSVSHDLRAPLRAIDGFSAMLSKSLQGRLSAEEQRRLDQVREGVGRMNRLIDDLLTLSRVGRKKPEQDKVDMQSLAEEVWREISVLNPDRAIDMSIGSLPPAWGDPGLLKQIMTNLVSNAVKFTSRKDGAVIEIGGGSTRVENIYYVKDNGAGFDMKFYDKLFGVFQRLHSDKEYEGTGVGLAIVQRIINRHGGRVWAEGKVGEGATFYFSLPKRT